MLHLKREGNGGVMKRYFRSTMMRRLCVGAIALLLAPFGLYCCFRGWEWGFRAVATLMAVSVIYMAVGVAIDEDETARALWPELYAAEDTAKVIAKAKKKR